MVGCTCMSISVTNEQNDFSSDTMEGRRQWKDIFITLKEKLSDMNSITSKPVFQK